MSITAERRTALISDYANTHRHRQPRVQVALLSERIGNLTEHLKPTQGLPQSPWPADARRRRRRLLDYLKSKDQRRYEALIGRLSLRR